MSNITLEWIEKNNFTKIDDGIYRLDIRIPYIGTRHIEVTLMPHNRWTAYYHINDVPGCAVLYTQEQVENLINAIYGR